MVEGRSPAVRDGSALGRVAQSPRGRTARSGTGNDSHREERLSPNRGPRRRPAVAMARGSAGGNRHRSPEGRAPDRGARYGGSHPSRMPLRPDRAGGGALPDGDQSSPPLRRRLARLSRHARGAGTRLGARMAHPARVAMAAGRDPRERASSRRPRARLGRSQRIILGACTLARRSHGASRSGRYSCGARPSRCAPARAGSGAPAAPPPGIGIPPPWVLCYPHASHARGDGPGAGRCAVHEFLKTLGINEVNSGACDGRWIEKPSGGDLVSVSPIDGKPIARSCRRGRATTSG